MKASVELFNLGVETRYLVIEGACAVGNRVWFFSEPCHAGAGIIGGRALPAAGPRLEGPRRPTARSAPGPGGKALPNCGFGSGPPLPAGSNSARRRDSPGSHP